MMRFANNRTKKEKKAMKLPFSIPPQKLLWGIVKCLGIYLLVCLLVPPLLGVHQKSPRQLALHTCEQERICLIENNEDALRWRLRMIRQAQEEIILSTFDFRADNSGSDVIAALLDAADRGVQVRLILDGINSQLRLSGSAAFQALAAQENVTVLYYNPISLTGLGRVNYRCHDKYLIIDRSAYLMGGRNTNDLFLGTGGKARQNMDLDVVVYGDASEASSVRDLLDYFETIWALDTNREFRADPENSRVKAAAAALRERWAAILDAGQITPIDYPAETIPTNSVAILMGDPGAKNKEPVLLNTLTALMASGKENVLLQTPYIICNSAMYDALKQVADSTGKVQILTNDPWSGANPWGCTDFLNQKKNILKTGASVYQWNGDVSMHTKMMLVDDRISILGSFNWDMRSAYLDTEMMLLVDSPQLNQILREQTDTMLRQSNAISPDGTQTAGTAYIAPPFSLFKQVFQNLLRIFIPLFRHLL